MRASKLGKTPLGPGGKELWDLWRSEKLPGLMADSQFQTALVALRDASGLTPGSTEERQFCDSAAMVASLAVSKTADRKSFEQLWSAGTGKTWKRLTGLPARIRNMAEEIEKLNNSPIFAPEKMYLADTPENEIQRRNFAFLPQALRNRADSIEKAVVSLPAVTAQFYWRRSGHSPYVLQLIEWVRCCTGKLCDKQVSALLSAADAVLNRTESLHDEGFDAQTLADLRFREARKTPKT